MQVRRMLTAVAVCALTSVALVTAPAQAAPSPSQVGVHGARPAVALAKKNKGAKVYNLYYDPFFEEKYLGYELEPPLLVFSKTKEWGFESEPGVAEMFGNYETVKGKINKTKYKYTVFYFNDMGLEDTYLVGDNTKTGWDKGEFFREGVYAGAWYAEKV